MKKSILFFLCLYQLSAFAQYSQDDVYDYIDRYKSLAMALMEETKIPASIKLAQAIYMTNAGTSALIPAANNHFGLLCNKEYTGPSYTDPRDKNSTCYRKYTSDVESYRDHAQFLRSRSRYNRLFVLEITDYKGWANGLYEAGYSINPSYAQKLIDIIEEYYLYLYDQEESRYSKSTQNNVSLQEPVARKLEDDLLFSQRVKEEKPSLPPPVEQKKESLPVAKKASLPEPVSTPEVPKSAPPRPVETEQVKAADPIPVEKTPPAPVKMEQSKSVDPIPVTKPVPTPVLEKTELPSVVLNEPAAKEDKQDAGKAKGEIIKKDTIIESGIEVIIARRQKTPPPAECGKDSVVKIVQPEVVETKIFKAREFEYKSVNYPYTSRKVYLNNDIKFVIAKKGDSFAKIAKEVQIGEDKIRLYNDVFDPKLEPAVGEVVYLQNKSNKSPVAYHTITKGETMRYIAQKYAIPLKTLFKRNDYSGKEFSVGNVICISCKKQ